MIITEPAVLDNIPHPHSLRCMKLNHLPKYSVDWQWVASIQGLEEIDVSFMDRDTKSMESNGLEHVERIHVCGGNVACRKLSVYGTDKMLSNLPEHIRHKVVMVTSTPKVCQACLVDGGHTRVRLTLFKCRSINTSKLTNIPQYTIKAQRSTKFVEMLLAESCLFMARTKC